MILPLCVSLCAALRNTFQRIIIPFDTVRVSGRLWKAVRPPRYVPPESRCNVVIGSHRTEGLGGKQGTPEKVRMSASHLEPSVPSLPDTAASHHAHLHPNLDRRQLQVPSPRPPTHIRQDGSHARPLPVRTLPDGECAASHCAGLNGRFLVCDMC